MADEIHEVIINEQPKRNCNCSSMFNNLVNDNPRATKISTSKIIQGACRVPSSLYTMNRGSMNVAKAAVVPKKNDKHGSYARYLARKKGSGPLLTQPYNNIVTPIQGNKNRMIGLMEVTKCEWKPC